MREAAKACASFGYHNPRNMHITANIKFYSGQPQVTEEDQKPMETKRYVSNKIRVTMSLHLFVRNMDYGNNSPSP